VKILTIIAFCFVMMAIGKTTVEYFGGNSWFNMSTMFISGTIYGYVASYEINK